MKKSKSKVSQFKSHGENKYEHDRIAFSTNAVGNYFNHSFSTPGCCVSYKFCCCFLFTYLFFIYFLTVSIKPIYLNTCGTDLCQISFLIFHETLPWQPIFVILSTQLSFGDIR